MKPEFADMTEAFDEESRDLLDAMEESLLDIQDNGINKENMGAVFRAAHTVKGAAGMFELAYLVEFTHVAENLLDEIRNGRINLTDDILNLFFEVKDQMQVLVDFAVDDEVGNSPEEDTQNTTAHLLSQLSIFLNSNTSQEIDNEVEVAVPATIEKVEKAVELSEDDFAAQIAMMISANETKRETISTIFNIKFKLIGDALSDGLDPLDFLFTLSDMGKVIKTTSNCDNIPDISNLNTGELYISFEIELETKEKEEKIREIFDIATDYIQLDITKLKETNPFENTKESAPEKEIKEVKAKIIRQEAPKKEIPKLVKPPVKIDSPKKETKKTSSTLRIEASKIDEIINLVGEMVIANANVIQQASQLNDKKLIESVSVVSRMLEEIREASMQTRLVPIGETFSRFKRIVRDLSKDLGKDIELEIIGAETELDKTVTEKISDPLIHLVRNSLDHGIESPEDRIAKGKLEKGKITLKAFHEAGSIAIQIIDNGKGLNPDFLFNKALEKGIVSENDTLTDKQKINLIMAAGFSTAESVTSVSGRGVGMDVVKRNIEDLRGTIDLESEVGIGTTMTIRLPLTLAIIDGFMIKIGQQFYIIPLEMIDECIELNEQHKEEILENNYVNLRGNILPLLDLREFFDTGKLGVKRENIIIVHFANKKVGLLVDELHGEFQTVIKPLGKIFRNVKGIGGATILGSGQVAMILDIPMLITYINKIALNHK
ncbi:MAG: chemotaxis protein CheA [Epsilonproteobacteria bacterium]|nr:MAG: chemotaxis protein CheA [Campylobacterota bacterium]